MYPLERWTRTSLVCLCLWLSLLFSMQRQAQQIPMNEHTASIP